MTRPSPIRGRPAELAVIAGHLAAASRGVGGVLAIRGGDGSGVTRLLEHARERALQDGMSAGFVTASPGDRLVPLGQLTAVVEDATTPGTSRPSAGYQALLTTERRLREASDARPVLLCLDDFALTDPESFAGLRHLAAELSDRAIAWVLGVRGRSWPRELEPTWTALERQGAAELSLRSLTPEAVEQIAEDRLGRAASPALRSLLERARGNPGLVVAVLEGLEEEGIAGAELLQPAISARVREVVRERLQPLSPAAHDVLRAVSVLGPACTLAHLTTMLEVGSCALLAPLDELTRAGILADADDRIEVAEPLVGDAVVASLAAPLRRAIQRQAADVLVTEGGKATEIVAHMVASVETGRRDAAAALLDATRGLGALDPSVAADVGDQLLGQVDARDPLYPALAAETAVLLHGAGRHERAVTVAAAAFAGPMSDATESRLRSRMAAATGLSGHAQARAAREALARPGLSPALKRRLRVTLLEGLAGSGAVEEAALVAGAVSADEQEAGRADADAARRAHALAAAAYVEGAYDTALARLRDAESRAPASDAISAMVDLVRSEALSMRQAPDEALAISSARVAWARRVRQAFVERLWCGVRGRQLLHAGRLVEALEVLAVLFHDQPKPRSSEDAAALVAFARVSAHLGRAENVTAAQALARVATSDPSPEIGRQARWLLATIPGGAPDITRPELPRSPADAGDPVRLVRLKEAAGEHAVAVAADRRDRTPASALLAVASQHAAGLLARDVAAVGAAGARLARLGRPVDAAAAAEDVAALSTDTEARVTALRDAHRIWESIGATADAARVLATLEAAGPWQELTLAERAVADLVAQGLANREVAGRLGVSPHTVDDHLRGIFTKLGVRSRVQLMQLRHAE